MRITSVFAMQRLRIAYPDENARAAIDHPKEVTAFTSPAAFQNPAFAP